MTDIRKLLNQLAAQEQQLSSTYFLAPCVRGGLVRTRVAGMIYTFTPQPRNFEGWGIFQPANEKTADVIEEPSLPQVAEYLQQLKPLRLRLAHILQRQTWLAYPVNEGDMQQRWGTVKPVAVHLVTDGARFEPIVARWDQCSWWFDDIDRRSDPLIVEQLTQQLNKVTLPEELRFKGITPEMQTVYDIAAQQAKEFEGLKQQRHDEKRLREALRLGGGELQQFRDRHDTWWVEWTTADGERHTSAIAKHDLTVVSAGICLSGQDRNFDLHSLVSVVEQRFDD